MFANGHGIADAAADGGCTDANAGLRQLTYAAQPACNACSARAAHAVAGDCVCRARTVIETRAASEQQQQQQHDTSLEDKHLCIFVFVWISVRVFVFT